MSESTSDDAIGRFIVRLLVGPILWGIGAVALMVVAGVVAAAGSGSMVPIVLIMIWTVLMVIWVLKPLFELPALSGTTTQFLVISGVLGILAAAIWLR